MNFLRVCAVLILLTVGVGVTGCSGGGAKLQNKTTTTTMGQQLIDLDKAYKQGIITEKEYNKARKEILKNK